ncbi:MAG: outer membrane protein assembly factor BamD [Kiritimatiellae bacterium]|nr:outer membrane protein assembly factor BamD [Kiritimatiellia bacterium]
MKKCYAIPGIYIALLLFIGMSPAVRGEADYEEIHKPKGWFFSSPACDNPSDQLSYAKKLQDDGKASSAARQYKRLVNYWPDAPEAASAQYEYARILDDRGKIFDAFDAYKALLKQYPNHMPYDKILDRMFTLAIDVMNRRKGHFLFFPGFKVPTRAVPLFEAIVELAPEWKRSPEAQYLAGQAYEAENDWELAIVAYTATLYRYPLSPYAEKAAYARASNLFLLSEESPIDLRRAQEAWAALTFFINNHPFSDHLNAAKTMRSTIYDRMALSAYTEALFYDTKTQKTEAALIAYRRFIQEFPHSPWTTQAEKRIQELQKITARNASNTGSPATEYDNDEQ